MYNDIHHNNIKQYDTRMTFGITSFSTMKLSITIKNVILSISTWHNKVLLMVSILIVMLSVAMLSVVTVNVVALIMVQAQFRRKLDRVVEPAIFIFIFSR
jgi:hypothetical protein